jgi:hypothetical protein
VGTSAPGQLLHLNSSASTAIQISDGTNNQFISSIKTAGNFANGSTAGDILIRGQSGFAVSPDNGSSVALRIDSSGNVLVGTTDSTIYNNGDSDSEGIVLRDGEVIDIARKGDLQLTLNRQTNDGHHIGFFRSGSPKSYIATRSGGFCIDVNSSERLRIDSSGRVGIGTSSPNHLLTLKGTQAFQATNSTNAWLAYTYTDNTLRLNYNGAGADEIVVDSSGNVGLGTSSFTATSSGRQILELNGASSSLINLDVGGARQAFHSADGTDAYSYNTANGSYIFGTNDTERMRIDSNGHFRPATNNTYDLGTSSYRWRNVYTNDLNLSNEGSANDVDGTWGNFTIQEGEDDLFLINRRSGKKYKFNLTEVN